MAKTWETDMPHDLSSSLENLKADGETITKELALVEAKYVLGLYSESGTCSSEALDGICGQEAQQEAQKQVKQLHDYIKKYKRRLK